MNVTVMLCATSNGTKRKPFVIFKGKGKSKEFLELKDRRYVQIATISLINGLTLEGAYFDSAELFLRVYNRVELL